MADIVTDGRVIMGWAAAITPRVESFGAPLLDAEQEPRIFRGAVAACFSPASTTSPSTFQRANTTRLPPPGRLPRPYKLKGHHHGAPAKASAGGKSGCRSPAARPSRLMAAIRPQRDGDAQRRENSSTTSFRAYSHGLRQTRPQQKTRRRRDWGAGVSISPVVARKRSRKLEPAHDERFQMVRRRFGFVRYADEEGRTWGHAGRSVAHAAVARWVVRRRNKGTFSHSGVWIPAGR